MSLLLGLGSGSTTTVRAHPGGRPASWVGAARRAAPLLMAVGLFVLLWVVATPASPSARPQGLPAGPQEAVPVFARLLSPEPGYVSDALLTRDGLVVSDRMDASLRLYGSSGKEQKRYEKAGRGPGGLVGHVRLALDDSGLYAWTNRGALMQFEAQTLRYLSERQTWMANAAGRFFRVGGRFFMVGIGWSERERAELGGFEYFWSEPDPPALMGDTRRASWTLPSAELRPLAELGLRALAHPASSGGFWVVRYDRYQVARIGPDGAVVKVLDLPEPGSLRKRRGSMPAFGGNDQAYRAWCAEATTTWGIVDLGRERFGILRADSEPSGQSAAWHVDIYAGDGRPLALDVRIPARPAAVVVLAGAPAGHMELLEIDKPLMEPGARHRWMRYALLDP